MKFSIKGTFELTSADEYLSKLRSVQPANLINVWPLVGDTDPAILHAAINDLTFKGFYNGTPPFLWQNTLFPDGVNYAPYFSRARSQVGILPAANINPVFNPVLGTILIWAKMTAAEIANNQFGVFMLVSGNVVNNFVRLFKTNSPNTFTWDYAGAGVGIGVTQPILTDTDWHCYVSTWNVASNRFRAYRDGIQVGSDQAPVTAWNSTALQTVGVASDGASFSEGNSAFPAMWSVELSPAEVAIVSKVP